MSEIQAVLFDINKWTIISAHKWLMKHHIFPIKMPHITNRYIRFRINFPDRYRRLRTKTIENGIKFIIGFL